jgi:glycosyltransferase involved in cell wall biosynthesis
MKKYSIILPVRNGSNHVKECVNSILSQTFPDFDLIVLENFSTDNTLDILTSFKDDRLKIYSSDSPYTIEQNWERAVAVAKNEFVTLIGHDDVLDGDYLHVMDDLINQHPQASLYQAHFRYIDSDGKVIGKCQPMTEIQRPPEAIHNFLCNKIDLMGTGFMMRSSDYDRIGGIPSYPNLLFADMGLWIELARKSYLAVDRREVFSYRKHVSATTTTSSDTKFLQAFDMLISYLFNLKKSDPLLAPVITRDSAVLLKQYCQGITHKILRTPKAKRQTSSVEKVIDQFREYGKKMGNDFEPLDFKKIRAGEIIDSNLLLHSIFLLFKRMYKKPVLGNC